MFEQANADRAAASTLAPEGRGPRAGDRHGLHVRAHDLAEGARRRQDHRRRDRRRALRDRLHAQEPDERRGLRGLLAQLGAGQAAPPAAAPRAGSTAAAPAAPRTTGQQPAFGASIVQQAAAARTTGQQPAMPRTTGQQPAMPRTTGQQAAMPRPRTARVGHANEYMAAMTTGQMAAMPPTRCRTSRAFPTSCRRTCSAARSSCIRPARRCSRSIRPRQTYAGSATLKPLLPYVEAIIRENQLEAITAGEFETIKGSAARRAAVHAPAVAVRPHRRQGQPAAGLRRSTASSC